MKKTFFFLICAVALLSFKTNAQLTNGLVGYWKLDGSAASATGTNNGTLNGTPSTAAGKLGSAYSFAPQPEFYISIDNSSSLDIQNNTITLSAWVYPMFNGIQMIVSKITTIGAHNSPYFQYNLQLFKQSTLYPRFLLSIGGTAKVAANSSKNMNLNQWHHVVGTYDGITMRLYLNGSQIAETAVTGNIKSYATPVYIGTNGKLEEDFIGTIDEVGIWNRTLTAIEVSQIYNSDNGLTHPFGTTYNINTTASPTAGGSIALSPSGGNYSSGTIVEATANANAGYTFSGWSDALTGSTNPGTITMNANKTLTATFAPTTTTYSLTITTPTNGTISVNPVGPNYASGTTVSLSATPNPGYQLSSWGGALSGSTSPTNIVMNGNKTVSATFTQTASGSGPWQTNGSNVYYNGGNVGIGTSTPAHNLQANGNSTNGVIVIKAGTITSDFTTTGVSYPRQFGMGVMAGQSYSSDISLTQPGWHGGYGGYIGGWFDVNGGNETETNISGVISVLRGSGSGKAFGLYSNLSGLSSNYNKYGIYTTGETYNFFSGKVGIGTATPTTALTVNGKILAKEVEVVSNITSDYVFEPAYQLMPLTDLEIYLKQHKHLPGIPSALEFKDKGQNLGEMQDMLLRKIEELTLYIIELQKVNSEQNKIIKDLKDKIDITKK